MSLAIDIRFTDPAAPLFIDVEGDNSETLFVISTSQVHGAITGAPSQNFVTSGAKKREREETPLELKNKKPMKVVQRVDPRTPSAVHTPGPIPPSRNFLAGPSQRNTSYDAMPPPSFIPPPASLREEAPRQPLFLPPSSSQLSAADEAILRSTGLGIESMDAEQLADLLEGDGEEVAFDFASQDPNYHKFLEQQRSNAQEQRPQSFELEDDAAEIPPTQNSGDTKIFQALFED